jgi:hypothetical protein
LHKTATVYTNDLHQPRVRLQISGNVEKFADIRPAYVRLTGTVGQPIKVPVTIIPEEKYPFKILNVQATQGTHIRFELVERPAAQGKGYTLVVENLKKDKGRYHDIIRLKTDSQIKPEISIRIFGYIHDKQKRRTGS